MTKPDLMKFPEFVPLYFQKYENYLPTAFNEQLSILQKLNKLIHEMNELGRVTRELFLKWNEIMEWIINDGLEDAVNKQLEKWLRDGTLARLINEHLFGEINDKIQELYDSLNVFDVSKLTPHYVTHISGIRNAVNQSVNIDPVSLQLFTSQSNSKTPEGFFINQLSPGGNYISSMQIPNGGHGTMFGIDRKTDSNIKIWTMLTGKNKLTCFNYVPNSILTDSQQNALPDYTPNSLRGIYFTPTYDPYFDNICIRRNDGIVEIRKRTDILNRVDRVIYSATTGANENSVNTPMQGCVSYGKDIYYLSGSAKSVARITKYDGETGRKVMDYPLDVLIGENGNYLFRDDFHEPEGLMFFVNPKTGKKSLLMVVSSGEVIRRYHSLYAFSQNGDDSFWSAMNRITQQNYALTKGDGRALSLEIGVTSLSQVTKPGIYYITNDVMKNLTDIPYPTGDSGWYLIVYPNNQTLGGLQHLVRYSETNRIFKLMRTFKHDRETFQYEFGRWTVDTTASSQQEYILASDWGNKISNVDIPGEYYLTATQMQQFTDSPITNTGFRLIIRGADSDGRLKQILERNSDTIIQEYVRNVSRDKRTVSKWIHRKVGTQTYETITTINGATNTNNFRVAHDGGNLIFRGSVRVPSGTNIIADLGDDYKLNLSWKHTLDDVTFIHNADGTISATNDGDAKTIIFNAIVPIY